MGGVRVEGGISVFFFKCSSVQTSPEVDATAAAAVKIRESESRADPTCLAFFGEVGRGAGLGWGGGAEGGGGATAGVDHVHNRLFIAGASRQVTQSAALITTNHGGRCLLVFKWPAGGQEGGGCRRWRQDPKMRDNSEVWRTIKTICLK